MLRPTEPAAQASYDASMKAFRDRPQIYVKVSEVLRRVGEQIPVDLEFYRPRLDEVLDVFGIDRVLYGSDWPNGDQWLPVPAGFKIVQEYFMAKGQSAAEKYFWRNSTKAYKELPKNYFTFGVRSCSSILAGPASAGWRAARDRVLGP